MQKSKYLLVLFLGIAGVSSAIISSNFKTISVGVNPPTDIELAKKVLVDLNSFYAENPDYEAEVIHSLFSNHTAKSAYESYSGYYKHSKSREHSVLMGIETIQNDKYKIVVDTNSKSIMIYNKPNTDNLPGAELETALKFCSSIIVKDTAGSKSVELNFSGNKYPLSKMTIKIRQRRIQSIEMWHTETVADENGTNIKPRTLIEYSNYKEPKKFGGKEFDFSHIVEIKGKAANPTAKYKNYQILDLRSK